MTLALRFVIMMDIVNLFADIGTLAPSRRT
jgi:hypothetical protein